MEKVEKSKKTKKTVDGKIEEWYTKKWEVQFSKNQRVQSGNIEITESEKL